MSERLAQPTLRAGDSEWRAGWRALVGSAIGIGTGAGLLILSASLFLVAMKEDFGGSMRSVTFIPVIAIVMSLSAPITGWLSDRYGSRRVAIGGLLYLAAGLLALAAIPADPLALMLVAAAIGIGAPASSVVPYTRCIATWFHKNAGTAFGITLNGISILSVLAVPLLNMIIPAYGWRAGFVVLAGIVICIGLPTVYFFMRENSALKEAPPLRNAFGGAKRPFLRDPRFWTILAAIGIASMPMGGFMAQFHPILASGGIGAGTATLLGLVFVISIGVGRLAGGFFLDRWHDGLVAFILLSLAASGALLFSFIEIELGFITLVLAAFLVGMGQGAEADFLAFFTVKIFGLQSYSIIIGIYAMVSGAAVAAGSFAFAALYDLDGDHGRACIAAAIAYALAGLLFLLTRLFDARLDPARRKGRVPILS